MAAGEIETVIATVIGIEAVMGAPVMTAIVTAIVRTGVIRFRYTTTRLAMTPEITGQVIHRIRIR